MENENYNLFYFLIYLSIMKKFIDWYIKKGFGSMTKNDFEVFIFNQWISQNQGKTNYEISRFLRIPESKVKRLRYEASLVYSQQNNEHDLKTELVKDLHCAKYKLESSKLCFVIRNKMLRQYINDILEQNGRYLDSSLTSSSVSIYIDDFIFLIEKLDLVDKDEILKRAREESKRDREFPISLNEIIKQFVVGVSKDRLGEFSTEAIIKCIKLAREDYNK